MTAPLQLQSKNVQMHLQPIFCLSTGQVVKVEALARLQASDGKLLLPPAFLSSLTEHELTTLFCEGLNQTLLWLRKHDEMEHSQNHKMELCINMPPNCLKQDWIVNHISEALTYYQIAPSRLIIEILETHCINQNMQIDAILALKAIGVRLGIDDLGSGHSSLLRLASHPFDIIKIDRGFIQAIRSRPLQTFTVIKAILGMASELNCDVVVEGLENDATIEAIRFLGGAYGQGFGLARPMGKTQLSNWLLSRNLVAPADLAIQTDLGALAYLWQSMRESQPEINPAVVWLESRIVKAA